MLLFLPHLHEGGAGPDELALVLVVLLLGLAALYLAFRAPSLPEYQDSDDDPIDDSGERR